MMTGDKTLNNYIAFATNASIPQPAMPAKQNKPKSTIPSAERKRRTAKKKAAKRAKRRSRQ